jgi:hypothetical protein
MSDPLIGTDVEVYWNLHRKVWSIRDRRTRRVVCHAAGLTLDDVTFVVSAAGNARVRREGRKNVHAFARGRLADLSGMPDDDSVEVTYNPYKHTTFVERDCALPVRTAMRAWFGPRIVWALGLDTVVHAA